MDIEHDMQDGSKLYLIGGRNLGKYMTILYRASKWCNLNPGKKAAVMSINGRLEMSFKANETVQKGASRATER